MPPNVREIIRRLEREGWVLVRTNGSHRIFRHPARTGIVVVPGKLSRPLPIGTYRSVLRQSGLEEE